MIDWHSHILPGVDDGSQNLNESLTLLKMLATQGVDTVVATPHFFANDESVTDFVKRRNEAFECLKKAFKPECPKILLGAEVRYYSGIGRMADLKNLRIEGSRLLLLEMPMSKWTEYTIRELIELASTRDIKLVLAHIERYFSLQSSSVWQRLYENGVLMQVNASYFNDFSTKRKAINQLANGGIHFVGSDCHNTKTRAPQMDKAFRIIKKKLGDDFISQMNEYGYSLLAQK